jgi:hypothetical protein
MSPSFPSDFLLRDLDSGSVMSIISSLTKFFWLTLSPAREWHVQQARCVPPRADVTVHQHQCVHCNKKKVRHGKTKFKFSEKTNLSLTHSHALARLPMSSQLSRAKFTLSAQFKPRLKPAW